MLRTLRRILGGLAIAFALSLHAAERAHAEAADDSTAVADDLPSKPTKDDVSKLIKKLRDKDALIRMKAAKLLGGLGADSKDALPELSKLLSDPDIDVRSVASNAMNKIQTALDNKQSLDDLQQKLNNALADKKTAQTQLATAQTQLTAAQKAQQDAQNKLGQRDQHIAEQNATIAKLKSQLAKKK